jgi:drug/metabolite transporter (DMT)-like permease
MKDKIKDWHLYLFGAFIFGCVIALICLLFFHEIPATNRDIINIAVGAIIGYAGAVVQYFFGSSKGSSDKTDALKNMQPIPQDSVTISSTETLIDKKNENNI